MTEAEVRGALAHWGLSGATARCAARRENEVWKIEQDGRYWALRFHRPGYRSDAELASELAWMAMLAENGLSVPAPVAGAGGAMLATFAGRRVSLLTWLPGTPIGSGGRLDVADRAGLARDLGAAMARLHDLSDAWHPPRDFVRPGWKRTALLGDNPLWGRFWEHPHLDEPTREALLAARAWADAQLAAREGELDTGLIHADLVTENVLIHGRDLAFIDFDDAAFGFRDFELATFLMRFREAPDYARLRAALLAGYATRRAVDIPTLDLFLLIRALSYVGWIADRLREPDADIRSARMIARAAAFASALTEGA